MNRRPAAHGLGHYEIRIEGHLDEYWSAWFNGLTVIREADGTTTLRGEVTDQAGLHGLLATVRDLIPPELRAQLAELARQLLVFVRAVLDWWIERLELEGRRGDDAPVEDIPIS